MRWPSRHLWNHAKEAKNYREQEFEEELWWGFRGQGEHRRPSYQLGSSIQPNILAQAEAAPFHWFNI